MTGIVVNSIQTIPHDQDPRKEEAVKLSCENDLKRCCTDSHLS
jgi:hypothetical protein